MGYDFIIDENLQSYIIEVNTNPCIEESSSLLKMLLPRMLDDLFRLTVDQVFNTTGLPSNSPFPVDGHDSNVNMWDHIYTLS
jgi:hypothetical protein